MNTQLFSRNAFTLALLLALLAMLGVARADTRKTQEVHLTILSCQRAGSGGSPSIAPIVMVADDESRKLVMKKTFPPTLPAPARRVRMALPPGSYNIGISEGICNSSLLVTILPGYNRNVVAILSKLTYLDYSWVMVSGKLPYAGLTVSIVYAPGALQSRQHKGEIDVPAQVDGDAYYATRLPNGDARLRVCDSNRGRCVEFAIGETSNLADGRRSQIFNVSPSDMEKALSKIEP